MVLSRVKGLQPTCDSSVSGFPATSFILKVATAVNGLMLEQLQNVMLVNPGSQTHAVVGGCKNKCNEVWCNS